MPRGIEHAKQRGWYWCKSSLLEQSPGQVLLRSARPPVSVSATRVLPNPDKISGGAPNPPFETEKNCEFTVER